MLSMKNAAEIVAVVVVAAAVVPAAAVVAVVVARPLEYHQQILMTELELLNQLNWLIG